MQETIQAGQYFHKGAKVHNLTDLATVDLALFSLATTSLTKRLAWLRLSPCCVDAHAAIVFTSILAPVAQNAAIILPPDRSTRGFFGLIFMDSRGRVGCQAFAGVRHRFFHLT